MSRATVSCASAAFRDEPLEAVLPRLAAAGYAGVEVMGRHLDGKNPTELAALRRLAREQGLVFASLASPFAITRDVPEELERSYALAGLAVVYGRGLAGGGHPPLVRVVLDSGPERVASAAATPEQWERATTALQRFTALDPGTVFAVETQPGTLADTAESALELLARVGRPNLCLSFMPAGPDPLAAWQRLRHAVRQVALKDLPAGGNNAVEAGPGWLRELLAALRADAFDGVLSVREPASPASAERVTAARHWLRGQGF